MKLPSKEQCLEWAREACTTKHGIKILLNEEQAASLIHRAYREGAEAMLEAAANVCDIEATNCMEVDADAMPFLSMAKVIRNLKVKGQS